PSGNEVGPFLAIEQAALAQAVASRQRTRLFAWYHLTGSLATAAGALACGLTVQLLQTRELTPGTQLPDHSVRLRGPRSGAGDTVPAPVAGGGNDRPAAAGRANGTPGLLRPAPVPGRGIAAVGPVRLRRLRRRLRPPESHRLLVPRPLRRRPRDPGRHP